MEPCSPASLQTVDTQLYADSVEWCPFDGLQHILLCGTYQLLETSPHSQPHGQPQVRVGQLQVYQLDVGHSNPAQSLSHGDPAQSLSHGDPTLSLSHCLDMPGILDIKWARQRLGTAALCGLVNAKGQLQLWALEDEGSVMGAGGSVMGAGGSVTGDEGSVTGVEETSGRGPVVPRPVKTVEIAECIGLSLDWAASGEGYSSLTSTRLSPPSALLSTCLKTSLKEHYVYLSSPSLGNLIITL